MKEYVCIKEFNIPVCGDNGEELENKETKIESGTVWHTPEDKDYRFIGGEVRLEKNDEWIEITKERLKECFAELI